ncbi:multiple sugar transport system permease protein/sn-glycerol 3-phosphate transport system permease protein [Phyllobacterium trifolii]|uniref:sn-glycerol-3-phosphate transport system permease protein UgpE n=1 Tax=Phyllobacterium trifolii TaxID=300193 RepID=A0A839UG60_9HYPH|nr:carbohydrate ABC transporter permease [Phyllobacterium trifolii]MBB3147661.1 multiple sugar transport system permease protein/sn-glycerol 3-phosphate transport system permease protein [Phyllobacterium trifolii]
MNTSGVLLRTTAVAVGLLFLSPLLYGIWISLQTANGFFSGNGEMTLQNYVDAVEKMNFLRYLFNSLIVSGGVTILSLATSIMAAYAFSRFEFRGRDLIFGLVVATLMIPGHITLIPNYLNFAKVGLLDTYAGLILPAVANGFATFFLRQYFRGIPRSLDEAAWMDGANAWKVLYRVIIPMSKPAIYAMGLFIFLGEWNSYVWPLIATDSPDMLTLQIGLARLYKMDAQEGLVNWPLVMAAATLTMLPVLLGFALVERHLVRGISMGAIK